MTTSTLSLLSRVFLCITFHWDVWQLQLLRPVLEELAVWPTHLVVLVLTEHPERLQETLYTWHLPANVKAVGPAVELSDPFDLAWAHRDLMKQARDTGHYTCFIYLEHDMRLTWDSIASWAVDQTVLEPLGFQRQWFRTEIAPWNGRLYMSDQQHPVQIAKYGPKLDLGEQRHAHQHYLMLPQPYSAVFSASASMMTRFIDSPYWSKTKEHPWPTREMAANSIIFVEPPEGFWTAAVVPYDPTTQQLYLDAALSHASNHGCGSRAHEQGFHDKAPTKDLPDDNLKICIVEVEEFIQ